MLAPAPTKITERHSGHNTFGTVVLGTFFEAWLGHQLLEALHGRAGGACPRRNILCAFCMTENREKEALWRAK